MPLPKLVIQNTFLQRQKKAKKDILSSFTPFGTDDELLSFQNCFYVISLPFSSLVLSELCLADFDVVVDDNTGFN